MTVWSPTLTPIASQMNLRLAANAKSRTFRAMKRQVLLLVLPSRLDPASVALASLVPFPSFCFASSGVTMNIGLFDFFALARRSIQTGFNT